MLDFHQFTNGNSLLAFGVTVFGMHELPTHVGARPGVLLAFLRAVQDGYPYVLAHYILTRFV